MVGIQSREQNDYISVCQPVKNLFIFVIPVWAKGKLLLSALAILYLYRKPEKERLVLSKSLMMVLVQLLKKAETHGLTKSRAG